MLQNTKIRRTQSVPGACPAPADRKITMVEVFESTLNQFSPRPRGWSDVTLGALFEMDFDGPLASDLVQKRSSDMLGKVKQCCCSFVSVTNLASEMNGCHCELCGLTSESDDDAAVKTNLPCEDTDNKETCGDDTSAAAAQSWACLTQRHTATRSVAITQRKRPKSFRQPNATR